MGMTLTEIAQSLNDADKKVQLIYAFNGTGKTRLSREFKKLINANETSEEDEDSSTKKRKILYYNALSSDLFYWDNDIENEEEPKLKIQPNTFIDWILGEQGYGDRIIENFQKYTNDKLTPKFKEVEIVRNGQRIKTYPEVTFSFQKGDESNTENIKISKGEESNFIWCIFYSLFEQVIHTLNDKEEEGETEFDELEYIFIDDPVTSLDENHLIELAVNVAELIKLGKKADLRFTITTHNPLFYNVLYNELGLKSGYFLKKNEDNSYELEEKRGDSNCCFSYHLHLREIIEDAIANNAIEKFHFTLLRNLYEKTARFLGYSQWSALLPDDKKTYYNRIIQFTSHSTLSNDTVAEPTDVEKKTIAFLLEHLIKNYNFWTKVENNE